MALERAEITIGGRTIGPGHPVFVVAELSANHHGDIEEAKWLIRAAKEAGADAVKVQTFTADTMTVDSDSPLFEITGRDWTGRRLYELYEEASMPWEWHGDLVELSRELGIVLFSSPFDATAVDHLERFDTPAYKIASFEIVDIPLIERVARTGKPIVISAGMATSDEISEAIAAARHAGAKELAVLKCTSAYPASADSLNLRTITDLIERLGIPIGFSDHTMGSTAAVAAVTLGAVIVEKHLTRSRAAGGPDAAFSSEPDEFAAFVDAIRTTERALGTPWYGATAEEESNLIFRRSLFAVEDIRMGDRFTPDNVRSVRPGSGLHPRHLPEILGRRATRDVPKGTPLSWGVIDGSET